jgi:hypothetical protein
MRAAARYSITPIPRCVVEAMTEMALHPWQNLGGIGVSVARQKAVLGLEVGATASEGTLRYCRLRNDCYRRRWLSRARLPDVTHEEYSIFLAGWHCVQRNRRPRRFHR